MVNLKSLEAAYNNKLTISVYPESILIEIPATQKPEFNKIMAEVSELEGVLKFDAVKSAKTGRPLLCYETTLYTPWDLAHAISGELQAINPDLKITIEDNRKSTAQLRAEFDEDTRLSQPEVKHSILDFI